MRTQAALPVLFRPDLPLDADPVRGILDRRVPWLGHGDPYSEQGFGAGPARDQGWKLHVSATPLSGPEVLERALPVLLAAGVRFKVINTQYRLLLLNQSVYGPEQVGKFIAVYPSDDDQAVRLAVALDEAARGLRGPRVLTDRRLRPGSLVHYRYGAFRHLGAIHYLNEVSVTAGAMLDADGRLTTDHRLLAYVPPPPEIADPFETAGVHAPAPPRTGPLNGRYMVFNTRPAHGGALYGAMDIGALPPRLCLIKEFRHDVEMDQYGRDGRVFAEHEAGLLARYDGDPYLPRYYDRFELDGDLYIVMELVPGKDLARELAERPHPDAPLPLAELIAVGRASAEALAHLHAIGLVFRDFKPANLMRTPEGRYRLVDFGMAYEYRADGGPPIGVGPAPFYSREQFAGEAPSPADDVFTWGAVMHYLAGDQGWFWERRRAGAQWLQPFARPPVRSLNPAVPVPLAAVIDRAVAWERADRYATMDEALRAFEAAAADISRSPGSSAGTEKPVAPLPVATHRGESQMPPSAIRHPPSDADPLALARAVGDALCTAAEERAGGVCWAARHALALGETYSPDLHNGAAGIALFLAELAAATQERRYTEAARAAARWLSGPEWERGRAMPGLHHGESGVGYFYLRLAALLDEPGYLAAAELRARRLAGVPFATPDLVHGAAGAAFFLAALGTATGERGYLDQARAAGDLLLQAARPAPGDTPGCYWAVPGWEPGSPPSPSLGLLHGAAGIGLALSELARATGEERYLDGARRAAELLLAQALPGPDGGRSWPRTLGDTDTAMQTHCHGAAGIGQFFLRLARHIPDPRYMDVARGAAASVAAQARSTSVLCHGLAGDVAFFLDCYQALGEARYLDHAQQTAHGLEAFRDPEHAGVYRTARQGLRSPDLLTGYAGIGAVYLRLARPAAQGDAILPSLVQ